MYYHRLHSLILFHEYQQWSMALSALLRNCVKFVDLYAWTFSSYAQRYAHSLTHQREAQAAQIPWANQDNKNIYWFLCFASLNFCSNKVFSILKLKLLSLCRSLSPEPSNSNPGQGVQILFTASGQRNKVLRLKNSLHFPPFVEHQKHRNFVGKFPDVFGVLSIFDQFESTKFDGQF